jgi:hypothetical protein
VLLANTVFSTRSNTNNIIFMSGVELLPFVWALPVTYFAASFGSTGEVQHPPTKAVKPRMMVRNGGGAMQPALAGHWQLDDGHCNNNPHVHNQKCLEEEEEEDAAEHALLDHPSWLCFVMP